MYSSVGLLLLHLQDADCWAQSKAELLLEDCYLLHYPSFDWIWILLSVSKILFHAKHADYWTQLKDYLLADCLIKDYSLYNSSRILRAASKILLPAKVASSRCAQLSMTPSCTEAPVTGLSWKSVLLLKTMAQWYQGASALGLRRLSEACFWWKVVLLRPVCLVEFLRRPV